MKWKGVISVTKFNSLLLGSLLLTANIHFSPAALAQQATATSAAAPVPPAILSATRIFISNAGADAGLFPSPFSDTPDRGYNQFYDALKTQGSYQLVNDPSQADLVLELRLTAPYGPSNADKQKGASDPLPMFRLVIYDAKTHFVLWALTEPIELAYLQKSHDRNFDNAVASVVKDFNLLTGKSSPHVP
jgi:hypothetical protein